MTKTIYLASSFSLSDRVEKIRRQLERVGHDVPDVWWTDDSLADQHPDAGTREYYDLPEVKAVASDHYRTLRLVEAYVLVGPKDEPRKFNGANVEFGYAFAMGVDIYTVGKIERCAMYEPATMCDTIGDLVRELDR